MAQCTMLESRSVFINPSDDEKSYFGAIDRAFTNRANQVISNGVPAHAVYLIFKFLNGARNNVKIYTGRLAQTINDVCAYQDPFIVMAAINFLRDPSAQLSIVVADRLDVPDDKNIDQHPFIRGICEADVPGTFTVYQENPSSQTDYKEHLAVMDDSAVRVELDPHKPTAFVNFGDYGLAMAVSSLFENIKANSTQLYPSGGDAMG